MRIAFTGGGTGGHFYPIIAVAQAIHKIVDEEKLIEPELFYFGPSKYDERALLEEGILYHNVPAGKLRLYFSFGNITDLIKTVAGIIKALVTLFRIFPDVIFAKGGYASFPILLCAKLFKIPTVIHESDTVPGRVNLWASKFARAIAISYQEASVYFPKEKLALTGNPIRAELLNPEKSGAFEFLHLEKDVPIILVLGGSQGSERINDAIVRALGRLVESYQIIHQSGEANYESVKTLANVELENNPNKARYKAFPFLNNLALRMSAGVANLVITRAGSTIFEIALWGIPSIVVPIPETISRDQRSNAFAYAHSGSAVVIEEANLDDDILISQISGILGSRDRQEHMIKSAKAFARKDAADKIARKLISIALEHGI